MLECGGRCERVGRGLSRVASVQAGAPVRSRLVRRVGAGITSKSREPRLAALESGDLRLSEPQCLPRAREAIVPTDKLVGYALNPRHPRGRHKARVFAAALGIRQSEWRCLHDQLLQAVVDAAVRGRRITPHGVLYDVVVFVDGLNGATRRVATIWLVAGERRRGSSRRGWTLHDRLPESSGDGRFAT